MHPPESLLRRRPRRKVPFPAIISPQPQRKGCHPKGRNEVEDVRSALTPLERRLRSASIPPTNSPEDVCRSSQVCAFALTLVATTATSTAHAITAVSNLDGTPLATFAGFNSSGIAATSFTTSGSATTLTSATLTLKSQSELGATFSVSLYEGDATSPSALLGAFDGPQSTTGAHDSFQQRTLEPPRIFRRFLESRLSSSGYGA